MSSVFIFKRATKRGKRTCGDISWSIKNLAVSMLVVLTLLLVALSGPRFYFTYILSGPIIGGEDLNGKGPQDAGYQGGAGVYLSLFGRGFGSDINRAKITIGGGEVGRYWLGDRTSYADTSSPGFRYGDLCWQVNPNKPVGINP